MMKRRRSLALSLAAFSSTTILTTFATSANTVLAPPPPPPPPRSASASASVPVASSKDETEESRRIQQPQSIEKKAPPPPPPQQQQQQQRQLSKPPPPPPPPRPLNTAGKEKAEESLFVEQNTDAASRKQSPRVPTPTSPTSNGDYDNETEREDPARGSTQNYLQREADSSVEQRSADDASHKDSISARKEQRSPPVPPRDVRSSPLDQEEQDAGRQTRMEESPRPGAPIRLQPPPPPPPPASLSINSVEPVVDPQSTQGLRPQQDGPSPLAPERMPPLPPLPEGRPYQVPPPQASASPPRMNRMDMDSQSPTSPDTTTTTSTNAHARPPIDDPNYRAQQPLSRQPYQQQQPPQQYQQQRQPQQYQQQRQQYQQQQPPPGQGPPLRPQAPVRPQGPPSAHQQQQQQQQRARPSPSQTHQNYSRQRRPAPPPPAWKRLWSQVERGLDNLADLEGTVSSAVSGTAQTLYSSATTTVKIPTWKKQSVTPQGDADKKQMEEQSRSHPSVASRFEKKGNDALNTHSTVESFVMRKRPAEAAGNDHDEASEDEADAEATKTSVPTNPYELLLQRPYTKKVEPGRAAPAAVAYRKPDMNALMAGKSNRMIRANGGASTPYNDKQRQPPGAPLSVARVTQESPQARAPNPFGPSSPTRRETPFPATKNGSPGNASKRPPPRRPYGDDEDQSWMAKLAQALPPMPRIPKFGKSSVQDLSAAATLDAWKAEDEDAERGGFLGLFRRKDKEPQVQSVSTNRSKPKGGELTPPLADLMERCQNGKSASVLSTADESKCVGIGRSRAILDIAFLSFVLIGVRQLPDFGTIGMPWSMSELISLTVPSVLSTLANAMDTWAPYAFAAAILATRTNSLIFEMGVTPLIRNVEAAIRDETQYGVLFLRLMSAMPAGNRVPERMQYAARSQILSKVGARRMTSFVNFFLASIFLLSASFVRPLLAAMIRAPVQIFGLQQWHSWPLQWRELADGLIGVFVQLYQAIYKMIGAEITSMIDNPLMVTYGASIVAALLSATFLPMLESKRKVQPIADDENEDETARVMSAEFTQHVSNLGVSGATRLGLLSDDNAVERVLERWRMLIPQVPDTMLGVSTPSLIRLVCYGIVSGAILVAPLFVHSHVGIACFGSTASALIQFDVAIILLFTHRLVWEAVTTAVQTIDANRGVVGFLSSLAGAVAERTKMLDSPPANLQLQASISNAAGLVAKDVWASHTTKRAWAIRGANLACPSGEILVVLGDDGSGKSRLLTTLAESMLFPPRRTLSTNRVRGSISLGGLDVGKWDKTQLKKRVGLMLNDVRTAADSAQVLSGLTLEEILEPSDGLRMLDPSHNPGATERASMMLALKITGLYSSLLPRLPSKLSTVLTANEEDLKPSPLKPRYNVVSPAEWSKLLLTKLLAQAIYDNENSAGSIDDVKNCLVGSILLLDDVVAHLSEVEEARTLRDLRKTGAATIFATNRWATGRYADRIAVVKDGTIVESGTHSELLNRGPQQSIYAAKWHAMTTQ